MTYLFGGELSDIPEPRERKWADPEPSSLSGPRWEQRQPPTKDRRRVTLHFSSYVGTTAIGATHYTVRIKEEDNPIWNSETEQWQKPWHDFMAEGRELQESFTLATRTVEWAKLMTAEHFGDDKLYDVDWRDLENFAEDYKLTNAHHLYAREGD